MGLGPYLTHFVELSGVSSQEQTDLSSCPPPLSQSAAHLVWGPRSNVDFSCSKKDAGVIPGRGGFSPGEEKKVWKFGKLSLQSSPSASSRRKPVIPWENHRPPFTELAPCLPAATGAPLLRGFPLAPGPCFVLGPGVATGPWRRFPGAAEKPVYICDFHSFGRGDGGRGNDNVLPRKNIYQGCF